MSRGRGLWHALAVALAFALAVASTGACARDSGRAGTAIAVVAASELPPEARQTLKVVREGGPFPYARDGAVFGNFERLLPRREKGYYREYTVATPGLKHRGASSPARAASATTPTTITAASAGYPNDAHPDTNT